jgi:hypothetical protein
LYPNCPLMLPSINQDVFSGQANGSRLRLKKVTVKVRETHFDLDMNTLSTKGRRSRQFDEVIIIVRILRYQLCFEKMLFCMRNENGLISFNSENLYQILRVVPNPACGPCSDFCHEGWWYTQFYGHLHGRSKWWVLLGPSFMRLSVRDSIFA